MSKSIRANQLGLELRHLIALDAVDRHRSFHEAARELGYSQSAVSQQIVALERLVGTRVFDRGSGPRPVRITEPGRVLLRHARAVLARVEAASADMNALQQGAVGELRIGTYQSVATHLLPTALARFRLQWPRIDVQLFESGSHDDIDDGVERGALDLAFTTPPIQREDLFDYVDILRDPYQLVIPPGHPLTGRQEVELTALAGLEMVGYRVCRANAQVERLLAQQEIEPHFVMRAEDNRLLQELVARGVGAAIMPLLALDASRPETLTIDMRALIPDRRTGVVWHRGRNRSAPMQAFVEIAQTVATELAAALSLTPIALAPES